MKWSADWIFASSPPRKRAEVNRSNSFLHAVVGGARVRRQAVGGEDAVLLTAEDQLVELCLEAIDEVGRRSLVAGEAIDLAGPGDVLVIYNGSNSIAPWGGLATLSCKIRGIEGVVVDGAVRVLQEIRPMDYPLFSSDVVPNAGDPKGMGEINSEIVCGGQTVRPGDYIVGDDSGVVVIPKERAYEIARRAKEVEKTENRLFEEISRGKTLSQVVSLQKWEKIG